MSKVRLALSFVFPLSFGTSTAFAQLEGTYRFIGTTARILETGPLSQVQRWEDERQNPSLRESKVTMLRFLRGTLLVISVSMLLD